MRLQWAEHAGVIMGNLLRSRPGRADYRAQYERVKEQIARLGGQSPGAEIPGGEGRGADPVPNIGP